jgi:hypothetical protein
VRSLARLCVTLHWQKLSWQSGQQRQQKLQQYSRSYSACLLAWQTQRQQSKKQQRLLLVDR